MGYHATIQAALVTLLEAALPSTCEVINGLTIDDAKAQSLAHFVAIIRESIDHELHEEINPSTAVKTQMQTWSWVLYVKGGGGGSDGSARAASVDVTLETIETALNAQRLTAKCGPLNLLSETFIEPHGAGVMYAMRWQHTRLPG